MRLPIDDIRSEFEAAIRGPDGFRGRLVVTAETGAGKSTRVPVWLAERVDGLVLVVEPRRVACQALADFLARERGERPGGYFGSRVRFLDRSSAATRVLFCTPGVALRMIADGAPLGALVVDEFHERSWQMDLVVAAAASLPGFAQVPLVLTSATIDAEAVANKLGAPTLHATGRTFPVEVRYLSDSIEPTGREVGHRVAAAIEAALVDHEGDALVFLPGMKEIRAAEAALGRRREEVLIVHGGSPPEAMRRVFQEPERRRIYLATNVAETSITLPGVRIVIDSGLAKTRLHRAGRAVLATVPISQASMEQRAGRAGRVAAGVCYRLWSERFQAEPYQRPEVERVELDDLLLQAADLGLSGRAFAAASWITPPPEFAVDRARARLRSFAALAVDGEGLTERGHRLAQLPVSAEEAGLLVDAPPEIDATLCDLVAILQSRGSLLLDVRDLHAQEREAVLEARGTLLAGVTDEVTMALIVLREGKPKVHHLSRKRLEEAKAISRQLRDLIDARGTSRTGLADYILTRLPAAGFVRRPRADRTRGRSEPWANGSIEVGVYPFEPVDPEVELPKFDAAVILETEWMSTSKGVQGIGRMVLPTQRGVLAAAGLGTARLTDVRLDKRSSRRVRIHAVRETQLAGVTLAQGEAELRGADLHRAVAGLVLEGRLFKGAADALRDALHGWQILAAWRGEPLDDYAAPAPPDPADEEDWLTEALARLGVETSADLELIEAADLVPDLEEVTGIPSWASEPVLQGLPRRWNHQGGVYSCTVVPARRLVTIEPADAKARKIKEPSAGALPRFQGFRVDYKQGSRRLRLR